MRGFKNNESESTRQSHFQYHDTKADNINRRKQAGINVDAVSFLFCIQVTGCGGLDGPIAPVGIAIVQLQSADYSRAGST